MSKNLQKLNSYDESHPTFPQRLFPDVLSAPSSQESPKKHLQQEAGSRDEKESDTRTQLEHKQLKPVKDELICFSLFLDQQGDIGKYSVVCLMVILHVLEHCR